MSEDRLPVNQMPAGEYDAVTGRWYPVVRIDGLVEGGGGGSGGESTIVGPLGEQFSSDSVTVTQAIDSSFKIELSNGPSTSTTVAASSTTLPLSLGNSTGAIVITNGVTGSNTFVFEVSYNAGTNWLAVPAQRISAATTTPASTWAGVTSDDVYEIYCPAATHVRCRVTAFAGAAYDLQIRAIRIGTDPITNIGNVGSITGAVNLAAGTNSIGTVAVGTATNSFGISSVYKLVAALGTTNAAFAKNGAGRLYKIRGYNAANAVRYLKLYNKGSAPTVGTDVPTETFALAPLDSFDIDFGSIGRYYSTGIALAMTTGSADADTTALTAADIVGFTLHYA